VRTQSGGFQPRSSKLASVGTTGHAVSRYDARAMQPTPESLDDYLATVSGTRGARRSRSYGRRFAPIVPKAEECISYRIPAFRLDGKVVAGFCARAKGCSYFPFSGRTLRTLAEDLRGYDMTKGALHFDPDAGLPTTLVRKLLKARIAETK
jgi:uncharacterized protein YdhG (YjbR/CyaY superfamily)